MSVPITDSSSNIKNAGRTIDLHSQTTKITNKLVIENTGKSPVCDFICALDARQNNHLNYTSALLREHDRPELKVKKLGDLPYSTQYWSDIAPILLCHIPHIRQYSLNTFIYGCYMGAMLLQSVISVSPLLF